MPQFLKLILGVIYTLAAGLFSAILVAALGSGVANGAGDFLTVTLIGAAIILPLAWSVIHIWRKLLRGWLSVAAERNDAQGIPKNNQWIKIVIVIFAVIFLFILVA